MTDQDAFDEWFAKRDVWPRITYDEVWRAALAWLRSQNEPVGRFNWETGEFEFLVPWDYETHNMKPLYLAPRPAIPAGWQLVPKEPTPEMVKAGNIGQGFSKDALKAAIAAAPEPRK